MSFLTFWMVPIHYLEDPKQFVNQLQFGGTFLRKNYKTETALRTHTYLMSLYKFIGFSIILSHTCLLRCCEIFMELKISIEMSSQLFHFTRNVVLNWAQRQNTTTTFFSGRAKWIEMKIKVSIWFSRRRCGLIESLNKMHARTSLRKASSIELELFDNCFERKSHTHKHTQREKNGLSIQIVISF